MQTTMTSISLLLYDSPQKSRRCDVRHGCTCCNVIHDFAFPSLTVCPPVCSTDSPPSHPLALLSPPPPPFPLPPPTPSALQPPPSPPFSLPPSLPPSCPSPPLLSLQGCRMVPMSCEQHDEFAAGTQFVTHTVGRYAQRTAWSHVPTIRGRIFLISVDLRRCRNV